MSRSRRSPSTLRSRLFTQAVTWWPATAISRATAMLDTVARPRWLSGTRKESDTAASVAT
ncbi:hypothetical protein [Kutzneria albida]|uniref:hypothetical protein n=1 Tax=Kutzneria albida TaxID=43357 RepID=UPI00191C3050|nr:hypothetical protein [Kutzneria albida]